MNRDILKKSITFPEIGRYNKAGVEKAFCISSKKGNLLTVVLFCFFITPLFSHNAMAAYNQGFTSRTTPDTATFAGGCFWCMEAQFKELKGVVSVESGFTGGSVANPSYEEVCTGTTGHAESINVIFDPFLISYDELLAAFFTAHDPTQLNRQGNDEGTQYRSAIFYHNATQKKLADYYIAKLDAAKVYNSKIVTEVTSFHFFYAAERYHQNYYSNNVDKPYCQYVIRPKLDKFRKVFKEKLKNAANSPYHHKLSIGETGKATAISFIEGRWDEALKEATAEKKLIFVDAYATWCGPCKLLKATSFKDQNAAAFFNSRFINLSLDVEKDLGPELAARWKIQGLPTLLILDASGKILTQSVGYMKPEDLVEFGKKGLALNI